MLEEHFWSKLEDEEDNIPRSVLKSKLLNDEAHNANLSVATLLQNTSPNVVCEITDIEEWNKDIVLESTNEMAVDSESEHTEDEMLNIEDEPPSRALQSINEVMQWAEENANSIEYNNLMVLHNMRQKMVQINLKKKHKQMKITSFISSIWKKMCFWA